HDRTPGPNWPLLYSLTANIANAQTVTGLVFHDDLPDSLMFIPGSIQAPTGCSINSSGLIPGVPGGSFSVTCPMGVGTLGPADVQVQYSGYALNVLDEQIGGGPCDEYKIVNLGTLSTDQGGPVMSTDTVRIYNMTLQQVSAPGMVVPGMSVTTTVDIQVSDYITAMDSFFLVVRVEDGLDFTGNSTLDGVPVSPISIQANYPTLGATQVTYDLVALRGGLILPGDSLKLTYETVVRQNYQFTGAQVLARDEINTFVDAHYHLVDELPGVQGCNYNYKATVAVIPNQISKEVIGGTAYVPGDMITYRLRMILPSGDANNVVFTDYFPIPVHNVANLDTTWGGANIVPGPNHLTTAMPLSITTVPGNNALVINFGNVMSNTSPETLEVYITIPVTTVPFANGLTHSNFLEVSSDNTQLSTAASLQLTQVWIGAPMLSLVKGVASVTNPNAWLTAPGSYPVNSNGINVDASDTVRFVSTISNIGGAQAFHIQAVDRMPMQFTGCQIQSVTNANGAPVSYSGTLFGPTDTLVIDSMDATGPNATTLISYACEVYSTAIPWETITNTMSIAWASAINQDSLFARVKDSAFVRVKTPTLAKTIRSISPGHGQSLTKAHVGEAVEYAITITVPEGRTDSLVVRDLLGLGLAFAGIDSIVSSSADLICSLGPIANIVPDVDSMGSGAVQQDRGLFFDFDQIFNKNTDNSIAERITIHYKARVLNAASNVRGTTLPNNVQLSWRMPNTGQTQNIHANSPLVRVVEPTLVLDKSFMVSQVTPGDSAYVTFTLSHDLLSDATAYDVLVTDTLPFGMNFVANSFSGACPSTFSVQPGYAGGVVSATWDSLEIGTNCQIRFKLSVDNSFPSCNDIVNRGNLFWESVYDPMQANLPNCPNNILDAERTGFANAPGQVNNHVSTSYDTLHVGVAYGGIPQVTSNAPVCIGNSLELNCSPYVGTNVLYIWTTPTGVDTTTLPQLIRFPSTYADSGYYSVVISDGGCLSPSSTVHLAAVVPSPVVMATGDAVLCAGQDQPLTAVALPAGNYNYLWTGPNGYISNQQNPILTNLTAQMAGNYTVQISGNGCTSAWSTPVNIQVLARPVVATVNDTLACSYGIVDLVLDAIPVSGTGPFTYYWTGPGGFASTMEDAIIPNAMAINQGNYIVTMTDSMGCVSLPVTAVVDIHDAPQTPVITQQGVLCPGDPLTLVTTAYAGGSVSYYWVTPNG
ncbi:MAG TPA: isopeptide-forming domain-containing fimbrial protein, partial [Bacteroidia bacterium]|nr:isopeptide-forming domain-containing fimbrial protein [Bacteroidia bacterium]